MHHQFANQELSRLDYAEAIRNSGRRHHVVTEVIEQSSSRSLLERMRATVADALAHVPVLRPAAG